MFRKVLVIAMVAALVASITAPAAVSAGSRHDRQRFVTTFWCMVSFSGWGKEAAMDFVRDVREESQTVAPEDASASVVNYIEYRYRQGCGHVLNTYVRARVSSAAYSWYLAVVRLNT